MIKIVAVRETILKHCKNCCFGICKVCILNTLKKILNYERGKNGKSSRSKSKSSSKSKRRG